MFFAIPSIRTAIPDKAEVTFMETPSTASVQEGVLTMRVLTDGGVDDADLDRRIDHRLYPGIVVFGGIAGMTLFPWDKRRGVEIAKRV